MTPVTFLSIFLNTEIDLADTFVQVAKVELPTDQEHAARALAKAREALKTVKHFLVKPAAAGLDAEEVGILLARCRALEAAIEKVAVHPEWF